MPLSRSEDSAVEVVTFGCRLNAYESDVMRGHAQAAGLGRTVIFNTCAVTGEAVRQAAQAIRRARREDPSIRIVVTGCAAQTEPERFAEMPEVDHVIGNAEKMVATTFRDLLEPGGERVSVNDIMAIRETAGHLLDGFAARTTDHQGARARAYVQVQNGCDHRCTFCIIPFGRGPSRSVPAGAVVAEVRALVEAGHGEVVLTGVDLTSYGSDLPGEMRLGKLVSSILKQVPELKRLRLSSIDSIEADAALMRALAEEERLMPHLHLSLQAGDDMILKRMKRRHLRADAIAFCGEARTLRPDIVFGADIIAGFPTETEEMFANSQRLVEECGLTYLHVFPFSPRTGTPAARMPQVGRAVAKERAARLRALGKTRADSYLSSHIGGRGEILVETAANGAVIGRTPHFVEVMMPEALDAAPGKFVSAGFTGMADGKLIGRTL
jgi:threonylcarbamoyladenosine tRNA methylthiotransferase MtaB